MMAANVISNTSVIAKTIALGEKPSDQMTPFPELIQKGFPEKHQKIVTECQHLVKRRLISVRSKQKLFVKQ